MSTVFAKIQLRRGTAAEWAAANPILDEGELGFEIDTGINKVGDGLTAYANLPAYATYDQMIAAQQAIEAGQAQLPSVSASWTSLKREPMGGAAARPKTLSLAPTSRVGYRSSPQQVFCETAAFAVKEQRSLLATGRLLYLICLRLRKTRIARSSVQCSPKLMQNILPAGCRRRSAECSSQTPMRRRW